MTEVVSSRPINCVLFDLDGTLADTAPDLADSLNRLLVENQRPELPHSVIRPWVSHGGIGMIRNAFGISDTEPGFQRLRQRLLEIYSTCLAAKTGLFPGMDEVLETLESRQFHWGIVTNKPGWLTTPLMQALNLDGRAACIVSGDTVEHSKPHPAPLVHACNTIGCAPGQTLYVGDAERDIQAGSRAGMVTLVALYGYIEAYDDPAVWGATGMVESPAGVLEWLEEFTRQ